MKIIVLCGPESTGKSSLCHFLAKEFDATEIQEIARSYIESNGFLYSYEDVEQIARLQVEKLNQLMAHQPEYIFLDTWLIITKVWFEVVFGKEPVWLDAAIRRYPIDLFLLCEPDIAWEPDPARENPDKREELFNRYEELIQSYGFRYEKINGLGAVREANALKYVKSIPLLSFF